MLELKTMNKDILYEILSSKSEKLSAQDIEGILNEELEKDQNEMDTDLVDLCIDALDEISKKQKTVKKKRIRFSKLIAAAIILVLLVIVSIPAGAKYLNMDVPQGVISFYDEYFSINLHKTMSYDELKDDLINYNVDNLVLPSDISTDDTVFYKPEQTNIDLINSIEISFENRDTSGYITLCICSDSNDPFELKKIPKTSTEFEYFNINETEILVFYNGTNSFIHYSLNETEYNIVLNCSFDKACEIAKTFSLEE